MSLKAVLCPPVMVALHKYWQLASMQAAGQHDKTRSSQKIGRRDRPNKRPPAWSPTGTPPDVRPSASAETGSDLGGLLGSRSPGDTSPSRL